MTTTKSNRRPRMRPRESWSEEQKDLVRSATHGSYRKADKRRPLRDATRDNLQQALAFFCGFLDRYDPESAFVPLSQKFTPQNVSAFADDLAQSNSPRSVFDLLERLRLLCHRAGLATAAETIATVAGRSPGRSIVPPPIADALQLHQTARAFFLLRCRELQSLGPHWRAKARARRAADEATTALMILILTVLPLRISNLLSLDLEKRLTWVHGKAVISIPGSEIKNTRDYNVPLSPRIERYIKQYLLRIRPVRATTDSPSYLFLSTTGGKLPYITAYGRITRLTKLLVKEPISPHRFRQLGAAWMRATPGLGLNVATKQLQHGATTTTEHYAPSRVVYGRNIWHSAIASVKEDDE